MSQCSSDVLTNIYNFILIDIIQILLIFLNHIVEIFKFGNVSGPRATK